MKGAEKNSDMKGYRLEMVKLQIDNKAYPWTLYEAGINEDFILGLDFLLHHKVKINLENNSISISQSKVPAILRREKNEQSYQVSQITCDKRSVIPPYTAKTIKGKMKNPIKGEFLCEVENKFEGLLDEVSLQKAHNDLVVLVYRNNTDKYVTLKKDDVLGVAMEFEEVMDLPVSEAVEGKCKPEEDNEREMFNVRKISSKAENPSMPEHLKSLFENSIENLTKEEQQQVHELLVEYQDIFSKDDLDIGCFSEIKHKINTGNEEPVKHKLRRTPLGFEKEEKEYIQKMLNAGVIRPSVSEWASSPVLIRKKDKTVRYCLDYRDVNAKTKNVGCNWPLPSIDDCLDTLAGSQYFSTIDLAAGYWQIMVEEEDIPKTAWISKYGHFESLRMPFGLKGAPSTMQRVIEYTLRGILWLLAIGYLDDVITKGTSFSDHLENLRKVFQRFRENNLKIKPKKCQLFKTEVIFLGRKVTREGITVDPSKTEVIVNWQVPKTTKQLESFLGFINYHREFIPNLSERAQNLFALKGKKAFHWEETHQ